MASDAGLRIFYFLFLVYILNLERIEDRNFLPEIGGSSLDFTVPIAIFFGIPVSQTVFPLFVMKKFTPSAPSFVLFHRLRS